MTTLFIHTYYQFPGGEDSVFEHEFELHLKSSPTFAIKYINKRGWRGALQFFSSIWNISAAKNLKKAICKYNPDIIHIHNWHFATGPIIIRTAKKMGIPIVSTLHNYRLLCPSATLFNKGNIFITSLSSDFPWNAVTNKVYRSSIIQTFWLAFVVWFHKRIGTFSMVDKYLVLTEFGRNLFINSNLGIPSNKFIVKPNFVKDQIEIGFIRGDSFLFIGRLSHEKGITFLLEAFKKTKSTLTIAGDGPLRNEVIRASLTNKNIKYVGKLGKVDVINALRNCTALVFPSLWYEPFGLVIIEAFSLGCAVIASNIGAPAEIIDSGFNGLLFKENDEQDFLTRILYWENLSKSEKVVFCQNARQTYKAFYTPEINRKLLVNIYQSIIDENKVS